MDNTQGTPDQPRRVNAQRSPAAGSSGEALRLTTLERLLAIEATTVEAALQQASQYVADALQADKVDVFLLEHGTQTLGALGTSDTSMGRLQHAIVLHRLPLDDGGRPADVFRTRTTNETGHADQNPGELRGGAEALGIRSTIATPVYVAGRCRGVLQAVSEQPERFSEADVEFLEAIARWVGMVMHRAELVEQVAHAAAEQGRREAADEIIAVLAHDLGNYLTPLQGRVTMLLQRARKEGRTKDVGDTAEMLTAVQRLQSLIRTLLDAQRLEEGFFTITRRPSDLVPLAVETAAMLSTAQTTIGVHAPPVLMASVDPIYLRQALANLLSNAVRYSPPGASVQLALATDSREDGEWVVVTVSDQGPGIPQDLLPRLFTRFVKGPTSLGLGLGLYLVRGIVEAHGGTVTVDSTPGMGTRFHMAVPRSSKMTAGQ